MTTTLIQIFYEFIFNFWHLEEPCNWTEHSALQLTFPMPSHKTKILVILTSLPIKLECGILGHTVQHIKYQKLIGALWRHMFEWD